ncbi:MAG: helix-turn-helix transcriptional regulator [Candidatus Competibacteraceae bacterium]
MNAPTNVQTIWQDGKPAFVVIPYEEFVRLFPQTPRIPEGDAIPHEVVKLHIQGNMSMVRAWREYLGLTQEQVATSMGISQAALSQMENPGARLRRKTLEKLAAALGVSVEQLR